jgi:hypothetical protein
MAADQKFGKVAGRLIKDTVARELWARAAGRCQFDGCNRPLYKSPVTQESVNISQRAHIYSVSRKGPRGRGPHARSPEALNDVGNLMLVCHDCHRKIDADKKKGARYPADLLFDWKRVHEQRIYVVTEISPDKKSTVVLYSANIGEERSLVDPVLAQTAMFPNWYPAEEMPVDLSMSWEGEDRTASYWRTEARNLRAKYERQVVPRIEQNDQAHFSLFALAPQPLLVLLGSLFTDKIGVEVYQLHREPRTWRWQDHPDSFDFKVREPRDTMHPPALIISLSDQVERRRITSVLGSEISIWEFTVRARRDRHNDCLRSREQLSMFRRRMRKLVARIAERHGRGVPLSIFPCMPVSCAVELGRIRMPKADMPWTIYDQSDKAGRFVKAIHIPGGRHARPNK